MSVSSKTNGGGDATRDPLDALADDFLQRLRSGDTPSVDDYVERYPHLSDEIRELFPTIASMERLKVSKERTRLDGRASLGGTTPERLGDFRIVREIGRGGMGVVYEAEQESLQRRVAVKVLPRHSLDTNARVERFRQEARTAARLHHTNVIPVFGVGDHDGFHYYVMQLIRGVGLDEVLSRTIEPTVTFADVLARRDTKEESSVHKSDSPPLPQVPTVNLPWSSTDPIPPPIVSPEPPPLPVRPSPWAVPTSESLTPRVVAKLGIQAAEALQYAHDQGVLHRDVKPGNLVLDANGTLFVTDFGLSELIDKSGPSVSDRLVGTLRFMAPEQFKGQADTRADVYSLGMTLYELLVKRPAFSSGNRNDVMRRICAGEFTRLRIIDPSLPRDLETIVAKATALNPMDRYATAKQLADDLRCWLEDRPIRARYVSPAERAWSWSRRNPATASLAATVAALLLAVIVITSRAYWQTRQELIDETAHRVGAEKTAELSSAAIDQVLANMKPRDWSGEKTPAEELAISSKEECR